MKLYNKKDLEFKDGYLVDKDGNVIQPDPMVVMQANRLETTWQQANHWASQPKPELIPERTLDDFQRESMFDQPYEVVYKTPVLDQKIEESLKLINEIEGSNITEIINNSINDYKELINWTSSDTFFGNDDVHNPAKFDTPVLGNPLDYAAKGVVNVLAKIAGIMNDADVTFLDSMVSKGDTKTREELDKFLDEFLNHMNANSDCDECDDTDCVFYPEHKQDEDGEQE